MERLTLMSKIRTLMDWRAIPNLMSNSDRTFISKIGNLAEHIGLPSDLSIDDEERINTIYASYSKEVERHAGQK